MHKGRHESPRSRRWPLGLVAMMMLVGIPGLAANADKPTSFDSLGNGKTFAAETGFNEWGYNYIAHMFSGGYCESYHNADWCQDYANDDLIMKWNEAWLSNLDQDGDGSLDRHWGYSSYIGSGAWLTNHMAGTYDLDGSTCKWTYFVKIVAVPDDATANNGVWYTATDAEIGPVIWGEFAVIQEVYNDECLGYHGAQYVSPFSAGFGAYGPQG